MPPHRKAIEKKLLQIAKRKRYAVYTEGIKLQIKRPGKINGERLATLCGEIKEDIAANKKIAVSIFGKRAVDFFEALRLEEVNWC
jgi:hypothetical protein